MWLKIDAPHGHEGYISSWEIKFIGKDKRGVYVITSLPGEPVYLDPVINMTPLELIAAIER